MQGSAVACKKKPITCGDLTEPNEDATLDYDLTTVNSTVRSDIKTAINGLVASGFTSIGDGLYILVHGRMQVAREEDGTKKIIDEKA